MAELNDQIIYKIVYGSHAYGTADKSSDVDIRGIWLPSRNDYLRFDQPKDILWTTDHYEDVAIFHIKKFFDLAIHNNPSVLEWLYVSQKHLIKHTPQSQIIRDHRTDFLSKEIYFKFRGYAHSEFRKLTKVSGKTGKKRRDKIIDIGYNPKSAMNCIRLLDQGHELLTEWSVTMPLRKHRFLSDIKHAKYGLSDIREMYREYSARIDEAFKTTKLPDRADRKFLEDIMVDIINQQ